MDSLSSLNRPAVLLNHLHVSFLHYSHKKTQRKKLFGYREKSEICLHRLSPSQELLDDSPTVETFEAKVGKRCQKDRIKPTLKHRRVHDRSLTYDILV